MLSDRETGHDLRCFFVSDLHGHISRYNRLLEVIADERPQLVFIGGDILSGPTIVRALDFSHEDFLGAFLVPKLQSLRRKIGAAYPRIFIILGNDDGRFIEQSILDVAVQGLWHYVNFRKLAFPPFTIYGYCYVPPTPFQLKDWERYDVSRYVDPGCIAPEEGRHSIPLSAEEVQHSTMADDLARLSRNDDLSNAVFLFHAPPYKSRLDRAALDGKEIDSVPLDVHLGSIAIKKFIDSRQPLLSLHGHVHESTRLTGTWRQRLGRTWMFNAAHDGPELALVRFDLDRLDEASRELI